MNPDIDPQLYDKQKTTELDTNTSKENELRSKPSEDNLKKEDGPSFTGWTPLITKTHDHSITPNSKLFNNILVNINQSQNANDIDYSNNFNLTPFLNHNLSLLNSASFNHVINSNGLTFTPFHDKSLQLADFFIDSPIRGTPLKDLQTITPSKFLNSEKRVRLSIFQDPKSAKKTSIVNLNKHTLPIDNDDETDEEIEPPVKKQKTNNVVLNDITNELNKPKKSPIKLTPSKKQLKDFLTPAKPELQSSPSTVILSSGERNEKKTIPNSPTPVPKDFKPSMGVFSEVKKPIKSKPKRKTTSTSTPTNLPIKTSIINSNGTRFKPSNRSQMQAGMNKFQIVLNGSTGSKRGRKKKNQRENQKPLLSNEEKITYNVNHSNVSITQNANNSSISHNHSNMTSNISSNMSNINISQVTDHTSFDQLSSTPNGKYLLDKMFEKPSPNSQNLLNQVLSSQFMPPPKQSALTQYGSSTNANVMMTMSTPTHPNIYLTLRDDQKLEESHSLTAFSYPGNSLDR